MEATYVSINKWKDKDDTVYIHTIEYYSEWIFSICSNMNGLKGHYPKWNKSDKDKSYITYMRNIKNKLVNIAIKRHTHK